MRSEWAIVAERAGEGDGLTGAGEIDRGIEGVAAATEREAPVAAARELDSGFADADAARLAHDAVPITGRW